MKKKGNGGNLFFWIIVIVVLIIFVPKSCSKKVTNKVDKNALNILSSYENKSAEDNIKKFAKKNKIKISFTYKGDLDIVDELNSNSGNYDAVWISNSMWYYMLDNQYLASNAKSISISPVVFGIKKSKAKELGLIDKKITNADILKLIQEKKIKYVMSSVTQTNTGATAYFGFLNSLAGNPEVLTKEMLLDENLRNNLKDLFSGVERVSGEEDYLSKMFLNSDEYEAVIADESSLININNSLTNNNKETLYLLYPTDGVAVNDSSFGFIDNGLGKEEKFLKIQSYLLSEDGQKMLMEKGKRTWYGGINNNAPKKVFNPDWGIDTTSYLNVTKFPSKAVMTDALNMYIEMLRKPTHVVFCLDYSGSMLGTGNEELVNAMKYILNYESASKDKLQFSKNDKITVITFSSDVNDVWSIDNGLETQNLINNIKNSEVNGGTALYAAIIKGLNILKNENEDYTKTIIAMTDGAINRGSFNELKTSYKTLKEPIPIYSITFGSASYDQLNDIANLSNARVFDGKKDLLKDFKKVRGYN